MGKIAPAAVPAGGRFPLTAAGIGLWSDAMDSSAASVPEACDLLIVSDIHLGCGLRPDGTYSRHEEFFYDHDFAAFLQHYRERAREHGRFLKLVLNGDILDFLAVRELPAPQELPEQGFRVSRGEMKYGLGSSEAKSVWKLRRILEGHRVFFDALVDFVAAGHFLVWNRGNHDIELFWPSVRRELEVFWRGIAAARGADPEATWQRVAFADWYYFEPGRIYVEHGHQYDPTNALEAQLVPLLPAGAYDSEERLLDYPIGSLFARYVYSQVRAIDPYRTHVITFAHYLSVVRGYNILDFLRTLYFNFPFFVRAVRNTTQFTRADVEKLQEEQARARDAYARSTGLSPDAARDIDQLRSRPLGHSSYQIFREMFRPFVRQALMFAGIGLLSLYGWILIFTTLSSVLSESIFGRASLMAVLAVLSVLGLFFALTRVGKAIDTYTDPLVPGTREKALEAARIAGVPVVVMGHTHVAELVRSADGITYVNSGTWIPVPGPWDHLQPHARQFTFVEVMDAAPRLLRWNTALGKPLPPLILADEPTPAMDRVMGDDFFHP